ncbi:hypothetical protein TNCV_4475681 [Trichonephila clavipes]|nr:hypothetical protein TNCV_4475681 [Trichonephila clavipes]
MHSDKYNGHGSSVFMITNSWLLFVESRVRVLMPLKTRRAKGLMHVTSVVAQEILTLVWRGKKEEYGTISDAILVTRAWFKLRSLSPITLGLL